MTLRLGGDGAITGCTSLENPDLTVSGLTISGSFDAEKVLVASGTAAAPSYTFSGDTDNGLYYAGTNSIGLATAGANAILIDSSGRVGVGSSSPGTGTSSYYDDLVIKNDGSGTGAGITIQSNSTNGFSGLDLRTAGGTEIAKIAASAATSKLSIDAGGSTAITVDSSQRVGIGATSPAGKLQILTGASGGNVLIDAEASSPYHAKVVNGSGDLILGSRNATGDTLLVSNRNINFKAGSSETEFARIDSSGTLTVGPQYDRLNVNPGSGSYDGDPTSVVIDGRTNDGNTTAFKIDRYDASGSASTKFFVNYAGNVGVGTASPQSKLSIGNAASTDSGLSITFTGDNSTVAKFFASTATGEVTIGGVATNYFPTFHSNGSEAMRIDSSGRLLVGTSSASTNGLLTVLCDTNQDGIVLKAENTGGQGSQPGIVFEGPTGTELVNLYADNNASELRINTAGTERLRIDSSGNIGIGTTSPQAITGYTVLTLNNATQGGAIEFKQNDTSYGRLLQGTSAVILESKQNIPIQFGTGTSSTTRMEIAEGGNVGIGVTDPEERLDLAGTLRINNLLDVTYGYPTKLSPLKVTQYGDYQRPVIALAYAHPGGSTKVNFSGFWGWIYAARGSQYAGHHNAGLYCQVSTAYNAQVRSGAAYGSAVFRFVTFTYDSVDYVGVQFNTDSSAQMWLDGYYFRRYGFKPFTKSQSQVSNITAIGANQIARFATTSTGNI